MPSAGWAPWAAEGVVSHGGAASGGVQRDAVDDAHCACGKGRDSHGKVDLTGVGERRVRTEEGGDGEHGGVAPCTGGRCGADGRAFQSKDPGGWFPNRPCMVACALALTHIVSHSIVEDDLPLISFAVVGLHRVLSLLV